MQAPPLQQQVVEDQTRVREGPDNPGERLKFLVKWQNQRGSAGPLTSVTSSDYSLRSGEPRGTFQVWSRGLWRHVPEAVGSAESRLGRARSTRPGRLVGRSPSTHVVALTSIVLSPTPLAVARIMAQWEPAALTLQAQRSSSQNSAPPPLDPQLRHSYHSSSSSRSSSQDPHSGQREMGRQHQVMDATDCIGVHTLECMSVEENINTPV